MLQVELKKIQNPDLRACKDMFSDFITQQFESELERSKCYRFKSVKDETGTVIHWEVWHHQHPLKKRTITTKCKDNAQHLHCSCLTAHSQGLPCRHILMCLLVLGEDLFQPKYFHPRWLRRNHLPDKIDPTLLHFPDCCAECENDSPSNPSFEFEGEQCLAFKDEQETEQPAQPSRRGTKLTVQQRTYRALKAACENLIHFCSHSPQLGEIATNAVINLEHSLRAGKMPTMEQIDPLFQAPES